MTDTILSATISNLKTTTVFAKNIRAYNADARIIANRGSTRSSKTYSILQLLYLIARTSKKGLVTSVVSESLPHLKKGAIRQMREMLSADGVFKDVDYNRTDNILRVGNSIIEFFSADTPGKVHGPERDILFLNECINIRYSVYTQLAIRTRKTIFLDYNPCFEFWLHDKVLPTRDTQKIVEIHSTYKDNEFLAAAQVREIESRKSDTDWWNVYGLGIMGNKQGLVFPEFTIVNSMPSTAKKRYCGLDFGFTNDPTALIDVRLAEGELWLDELLYGTGHGNTDIIEAVPRNVAVIADSAEPKSIAEICKARIHIEAARKGADSIRYGITQMKRFKINITSRSLNLIKEFRSYKWLVDRNENQLNTPIDTWNHGIDAVRYVVLNKLSPDRPPLTGVRGAKLVPM